MNKAKPILFSTPMIQALLEGRKTQTRRIVKPQPNGSGCSEAVKDKEATQLHFEIVYGKTKCPYGGVGDLLWVRETIEFIDAGGGNCVGQEFGFKVKYKADHTEEWCFADNKNNLPRSLGVKPSIFMPKWASRLTLEITNIRVERLNDISWDDAEAEGALKVSNGYSFGDITITGATPKGGYYCLWERLNGKGSWDKNPWVWVIEFKVHRCSFQDLTTKEQPHDK